MGLLSDTKSRKKLTDVLIQHYEKLISLSFIIGIVWFCLLASDVFNNKTYFSENALLPGLVVREFNPRSSLSRRLDALNEESKLKSPFVWIQGQFRQLGLDVYQNNFTVQYPFGSPKSLYKNKNFYAILRAPKVSSTEAIVISTPYRDNDSIHPNCFASIALMIELAQAFRQQTYWSKDIIFLITQFENIGFQAWLDAYHSVQTSDYIRSEKLPSTSGPLQGVINLEISDYHFSHLDVKIEGLHGQLPNLDFFNLVIELCAREQIPTTFEGRFNHYSIKSVNMEAWLNNFLTMSSMMSLQATGLPTGGHGLFHRFGIQALTLKSVEEKKSVNLVQLGRVVEGTVRSLNNLLEKFHQSFFFYLLPSTRSYVSIGLYMPPFALIAVPILLKALYLYLNGHKSESLSCKFNYWIALDSYIFHLMCGLIIFLVPNYIHHVTHYFHIPTSDLMYYTLLILMSVWLIFASITTPKVMSQKFEYKMCFTLLMLGGFMFTLALVNISLALVFTILYVPISISLQYKGKLSVFQYLILLLIHPFVFSYLLIVAQSYMLDSKLSWWSHFVRGVDGHKKVVLFTMEDMLLFGNWNYKIVSLIILPLWLNLWSLKSMASRVEN
ncbi:glycosylphosphatidylinositol anchor attachment 1 protein [Parasteatoda tepidariorum]|uniref:glycosylphosphatidylinositol anchor attachment 1 protein n=1 Tax=Parasteatoda tepidariorum TaxID=114398 RepID=UPI00077FC691|nr:glycosylphosphatidylinositol anchor attachment 1 protein-like [Parasteatoda tepidariorum]